MIRLTCNYCDAFQTARSEAAAKRWRANHNCDPEAVRRKAQAILETITPDPPGVIARRAALAAEPE